MLMIYTKIYRNNVSDILLKTRDHCTGHVYLLNINRNLILGHNEKHDNVCSFGGFRNSGETLMETITREFREETLDCVLPYDVLEKMLLEKSVIITRTSIKGQHYTVFCNADDHDFDLEKINHKFKNALTDPDLTPDQMENDQIVMVNLDVVADAIRQNESSTKIIVVPDITNSDCKIRDINVPAYKWFIESLTNNNLDDIF